MDKTVAAIMGAAAISAFIVAIVLVALLAVTNGEITRTTYRTRDKCVVIVQRTSGFDHPTIGINPC